MVATRATSQRNTAGRYHPAGRRSVVAPAPPDPGAARPGIRNAGGTNRAAGWFRSGVPKAFGPLDCRAIWGVSPRSASSPRFRPGAGGLITGLGETRGHVHAPPRIPCPFPPARSSPGGRLPPRKESPREVPHLSRFDPRDGRPLRRRDRLLPRVSARGLDRGELDKIIERQRPRPRPQRSTGTRRRRPSTTTAVTTAATPTPTRRRKRRTRCRNSSTSELPQIPPPRRTIGARAVPESGTQAARIVEGAPAGRNRCVPWGRLSRPSRVFPGPYDGRSRPFSSMVEQRTFNPLVQGSSP